ncbi:MAG: hypothetical protein IPF82_17080 [Blastocatellia bacterium]|nr:hypothetical protein [Blastocatellia bacterium]
MGSGSTSCPELRNATRGHRIAASLAALSRIQTPREDQKLVATLGQIINSLLTEPDSFPDPGGWRGRVAESKEDVRTAEAIDPAAFIRSIEEVSPGEKGRFDSRGSSSLSLSGIMRALFGADAAIAASAGDGTGDGDRYGEDSAPGPSATGEYQGTALPGRAYAPDDRSRRRLTAPDR